MDPRQYCILHHTVHTSDEWLTIKLTRIQISEFWSNHPWLIFYVWLLTYNLYPVIHQSLVVATSEQYTVFFLSNIYEHFQFTDNSCIVAERKIEHWSLKSCVFMLSIVKSFEIFPKHKGDGFISRSFSLNWWTFKPLKNKKMLDPLTYRLKQIFFLNLVILITYLSYLIIESSSNVYVAYSPRTTISFFYY